MKSRIYSGKKKRTNVEESRSPRHQVKSATGMLFTFHLTDILTAILYGTMFSSDIASAAFRASSSLCKQQNTATKKIDFLPLAVRSARIMRADYTRLYAECTARADVGLSLARSTLCARIADPANATNGTARGRAATGDQQ